MVTGKAAQEVHVNRWIGFLGTPLAIIAAIGAYLESTDPLSLMVYFCIALVPALSTGWFSVLLFKNKDYLELLPLCRSIVKSFQSLFAITIATTGFFALFPDSGSLNQFQQALVPMLLCCVLYAAPFYYFSHNVHRLEARA